MLGVNCRTTPHCLQSPNIWWSFGRYCLCLVASPSFPELPIGCWQCDNYEAMIIMFGAIKKESERILSFVWWVENGLFLCADVVL